MEDIHPPVDPENGHNFERTVFPEPFDRAFPLTSAGDVTRGFLPGLERTIERERSRRSKNAPEETRSSDTVPPEI